MNLEALAEAVDNLQPPPEAELADYIGHLDHQIRRLQGFRKSLMDEAPGPIPGREYRIVAERSATRSYNTGAILSRFAERGWDLHDLRRADAVRLTWRWTQLKDACRTADVPLIIEHREIEDSGDIEGPMVGEVWTSRLRPEPVTPSG